MIGTGLRPGRSHHADSHAHRSNAMSAEPMKDCPIGVSWHQLARVDLHGEWRILVMTNMADDETGNWTFELRSCGCRAGAAIAVRPE
jgi:hypothetical protein